MANQKTPKTDTIREPVDIPAGPPTDQEHGHIDPFIGKQIGNCQLLERMNEGGTAFIYRAHNTRFDLDRRDSVFRLGRFGEFVLHLTNELLMLVNEMTIGTADPLAHPTQVLLQDIENTRQGILILHLSIEFAEHAIRIGDRRDGIIGTSVNPAGPRIGTIGHRDAELQ